MENQELEKKVGKLDWGIIFSCIIMLLIVYIPSHIWREEVKFREESRKRMGIIADAEEFYKELIGEYTTDGLELFELVESALDSTISDSLFLGEQLIYLDKKSLKVNMSKGFKFRADTTFSDGVSLKRTIKDTIYTIGLINEESGNIDTVFVNSHDLITVKNDTLFHGIFHSDTTSYSESYTDYLRKKYKLTPELLNCPLTGQPYTFEINSDDPDDIMFIVKSPVPIDYKESRFIVFKFESGNHGSITGGQKSWAGD